METVINLIKEREIHDKFEIIYLLFQKAFKIFNENEIKYKIVESYITLHDESSEIRRNSAVSLNEIELIIDSFLYIRKKCNLWNTICNFFFKFYR